MKIFLIQKIGDAGLDLLRAAGHEIIQPDKEKISHEERLAFSQQCDVVIDVGFRRYDRAFFEKCPNVKAIALFSVGYDNVDVEAAREHGVKVGNTPDVVSKSTSDMSFLLMQMVARRADFYMQQIKKGEWKRFEPISNLGQELYGKTLGIFGLGRIGYEMAIKCKLAFDMNIIYHNRKPRPEMEAKLDAQYVSFDELITRSDVLSIHASYAPENRSLFNKEIFRKMKPGSILVNTARGGFINEDDLYEALIAGEIWGAGLDVTFPEPMSKDSPLLGLSTVCIMPHIGSSTMETRDAMAIRVAENILAFADGKPMPYPVV